MQYASSAMNQANSSLYQGAVSGSTGMPASAPKTIQSAIGRLDGVNERLSKVQSMLDEIAGNLGAHRLVSGSAGERAADNIPTAGAVARLNGAADAAHANLSSIEDTLAAIQRALG